MFCLKFFGFFDLLHWFVFSLGPEHHLLLVVAVRRYRLLPRHRHHRNIQNPRWLFRDTKIVSFLKYFLCISFSIPFMWFQLSCTQYFELIALNWPFKDVSLVSEELAWFPVLEPVLHRLHLDPLQQQPKNAPGLRDLVDADPPERRFEIFFFSRVVHMFFSLFFIVSFIYLFCDINIQVPEMDEEARLASELKKLEKEQERKKKELELVEKRKKDQHAKAASRHISICFVIVFFPAVYFVFKLSFFSFPSVCKCMRFLKS